MRGIYGLCIQELKRKGEINGAGSGCLGIVSCMFIQKIKK